jgi:hypothetical protein
MFCFEATALFAFGVAWMVKGQAILKDELVREEAAEAELREERERRKEKHELAGA